MLAFPVADSRSKGLGGPMDHRFSNVALIVFKVQAILASRRSCGS